MPPDRRITQAGAESDSADATPDRRITQVGVEADAAPPGEWRVTQAGVEADVSLLLNRVITQVGVEADVWLPYPGQGISFVYAPALLFTVEVALASNPTDPPTWEDVSSYVRHVSIRRGRQHELDRIEAGTCTVLLDNRDRRFDPTHTGGPYYGKLLPMRRIRVNATWAGVTYPLFAGYVESWPPSYPALGYDAVVELEAVDGLKVLALKRLNVAAPGWPEESTDARVNRVLDAVSWATGTAWVLDSPAFTLGVNTVLGPLGDRIVNSGSSQMQAATPTDQAALEHIRSVEEVESGLFFMSKDGLATFQGRAWRQQPQQLVSKGTFGDGAGELPYRDLRLSFDDSRIWNEIRVKRSGSGPVLQTAQDAVSQARYYPRTLSREDLPLAGSDWEALDQANYLLARYKEPGLRVTALVLKPARDQDALWPQVLGREISDRVTAIRRPLGGGAPIQQDCLVEAVEHEIGNEDWTTSWALSPASGAAYPTYWLLEDATYGILNTSTRLGY